jgi:hypothetical protein
MKQQWQRLVTTLLIVGSSAEAEAQVPVGMALTRQLSVSLVGQNLLDRQHAEYAGAGAIVTSTQMPRSGQVQRRWQF